MNLKKIISNAFVLLGAVIGGGLSTGKELSAFFCKYGANFWISNIICVISVVLLLMLISKNSFNSKNTFIEASFFIVRLIICSTMISSLHSVCIYFPNSTIVYILFLILFFVCMFLDLKKISIFFSIIVPLIIITLVSVCILGIKNTSFTSISSTFDVNIIINPISYASFNLFLLIYIVKNILNNSTKKEKIYSILLFSLLFFALIFVMCYAIIKSGVISKDIPILSLTEQLNLNVVFVTINIVLAILSTFIGISVDLINVIKEKIGIKNSFIINSIIFIFCLLISNIGLNVLVNFFYKFIGYFSLIYFFIIFIKYLTTKNTALNYKI